MATVDINGLWDNFYESTSAYYWFSSRVLRSRVSAPPRFLSPDAPAKRLGRTEPNRTEDFHVAGFGGTKSLILTTLSPIGDRNGVLGSAFMAVGGASLVAGLVVLSRFQKTPRSEIPALLQYIT